MQLQIQPPIAAVRFNLKGANADTRMSNPVLVEETNCLADMVPERRHGFAR